MSSQSEFAYPVDVPYPISPIVQSFIAPRTGYVTGVRLYFRTKSNFFPIEVQLRPMAKDIPSPNARASVLLRPEQVNISTDSSLATEVIFPNPAWVTRGFPHCIALQSVAIDYSVFVARLGSIDILSNYYVLVQPNAGVLFLSPNGQNWTPQQYLDLKFQILYAEFTRLTGTLKFNQIKGIIGSTLVNRTWYNSPLGTSVSVSFSKDNNIFTPITPNNFATYDAIRRRTYMKVDLIGYRDQDGFIVSPSISKWASHPWAYSSYGRDEPWDFPNHIETNYVSRNSLLTTDGFSEIRVISDEFVPSNCFIIGYVSTDDGDTWVRLPNSVSDRISGIQDYSSTSKGGLISEIIRTMTFNPIQLPVPSVAPAKAAGSGSFSAGDYQVSFSFYNQFGESLPSVPTAVTSVSAGDRIVFTLPTGTNWPTGYTINPAPVTGIYVYVGTTVSNMKRVAFTGTQTVGQVITISSEAPLDPEVVPSLYNQSVPTNFRIRLRLIAPRLTYYILDPSAAVQGFSTGIDAANASVPGNTNYSIVQTWLSDRGGETRPSISLDGSGGRLWAATPNGSNQNFIIMTALPEFQDRADGMYIYIKASGDVGAERRVNVSVTRDGIVQSVPYIKPTDTGPFKILSVPSAPGINPPTVNLTTPLGAKAPQVSKLRVLVHDEPTS